MPPNPPPTSSAMTADPCLGNAERRGHFAAYPMHDLRRRPHRSRVGARVVGGDDTAALHRHGRVAMVPEAALQSMRRARQHRLGIPLGDGERADQICVVALVHDRRAGLQRGLGVHHCRQLFQIEPDQLGGVLGLVAGLGDDDRDRLADMPDLVVREQRLLRVEEFVLDDSRPFAWHAYLALRPPVGPAARDRARTAPARLRVPPPPATGRPVGYGHAPAGCVRTPHAACGAARDRRQTAPVRSEAAGPPAAASSCRYREQLAQPWFFPDIEAQTIAVRAKVGIHVSADRPG